LEPAEVGLAADAADPAAPVAVDTTELACEAIEERRPPACEVTEEAAADAYQ